VNSQAHQFHDSQIEFLKLSQASELTLDEFYVALLQETFPANELETLEQFKKALGQNADGILALIDGRVAGGLVCEDYVQGSVKLLGYIVVRNEIRGRGLGATLLHLGMQQSDSVLALGEIEDPRYWPTSSHNDPISRLRFWAGEGCKLLPLPYVQPALGSESERVQHMLLIAVPREHEPIPDTVPGDLVEKFLREYYIACEGSISEDDVELQKLLAASSVENLRLWPLDRLDAAEEPS
jgi:Acetyltransferase (GNAT) family